ncbi:hypothetical protein BIW11_13931, partial [Tropilaelaps mercedesae]
MESNSKDSKSFNTDIKKASCHVTVSVANPCTIEEEDRPFAQKSFEQMQKGVLEPGDCGSSFDKPAWFDAELYERGRKVLWDNLFIALFCHLASLVLGMSSEIPYKVLLHNGQHFTLRALACRYISTTKQVLSWYQTDIFDPSSEGYKSVRRVRDMHLTANRYMERLETRPNGERWISQYWMACTQSSFIRLMVMYPHKVGLRHLGDKDFEGIVHYWGCIGKRDVSIDPLGGYLMGISDEYNTCSAGLTGFRRFNSTLAEREVIPALLSCSQGQMKLGESIIQALLAVVPVRLLPLSYPAFITFFAQVCELNGSYPLTRTDRLCLWMLKAVFQGPLFGFSLIRRLIRKRILERLQSAQTASVNGVSDDLIEATMYRYDENCDVTIDVDKTELTWDKLLEGRFEDGDCGNPLTKPNWFDKEKYLKGRLLLYNNLLSCMFCHLAGLVLGVAIELPYVVLTNIGHHGSLKDIGARYVSTSKKIISWYSTDIFDSNSEGSKSVALVRQMHAAAHRTMKRSHARHENDRELWFSQFYMATTQISFVGFMILFPRAVGLRHFSREDQEAVLHYWRCIGYLLGISDSYNICGGSVETVRTLTRDFVDKLLRPSILTTSVDRFKLAKGILQSVLISTNNRTATVNGFI